MVLYIYDYICIHMCVWYTYIYMYSFGGFHQYVWYVWLKRLYQSWIWVGCCQGKAPYFAKMGGELWTKMNIDKYGGCNRNTCYIEVSVRSAWWCTRLATLTKPYPSRMKSNRKTKRIRKCVGSILLFYLECFSHLKVTAYCYRIHCWCVETINI
jgi:hypothetical protein